MWMLRLGVMTLTPQRYIDILGVFTGISVLVFRLRYTCIPTTHLVGLNWSKNLTLLGRRKQM